MMAAVAKLPIEVKAKPKWPKLRPTEEASPPTPAIEKSKSELARWLITYEDQVRRAMENVRAMSAMLGMGAEGLADLNDKNCTHTGKDLRLTFEVIGDAVRSQRDAFAICRDFDDGAMTQPFFRLDSVTSVVDSAMWFDATKAEARMRLSYRDVNSCARVIEGLATDVLDNLNTISVEHQQ